MRARGRCTNAREAAARSSKRSSRSSPAKHGNRGPAPFSAKPLAAEVRVEAGGPDRGPVRMATRFCLVADFEPKGDQPHAIAALTAGVLGGVRFQTLLGVTGSGKTFTMANVIERVQRPALVIAHNKTLAAQLYAESRDLFPENAVEFFVSYYDYYQPEAYLPATDTYIEKETIVNDEIERMRHAATAALRTRDDVIVVASVSCIYGLGTARSYFALAMTLRPGESPGQDCLIRRLVEAHYRRDEIDFYRGRFRVRGDTIDIFPADEEDRAVRVELFGDTIERLTSIDPLRGATRSISPAATSAFGVTRSTSCSPTRRTGRYGSRSSAIRSSGSCRSTRCGARRWGSSIG